MAEYIEREAAVNLILETPFTMSMCLSEQECHGMNRAKQIFARLMEQAIPAANVRENVTGEWIYKSGERYKEYTVTCPFCGSSYMDCYDGYINADDFNFCPNCGADMRGGDDGDSD